MALDSAAESADVDRLRLRVAELEAENERLRCSAGAGGLPAAETLSAVIRASPLPMVALTAGGNVTLWNPAAERVFGWTAGEAVGAPLPFVPSDKLEEHRLMRAHDLSGQGFSEREVRRRRKDGSPVDVNVSTAPIRDAAGRVAGTMAIYVDVTERKAIEDWLQQQAELLEQAHDPMLAWELDGPIRYWNRAAEQLYGYTKSEAVGQVSHVLLQTEVVGGGTLVAALQAARRWSGQLLHTTRGGRRIVVESRQVVIRTAKGVDIVLETNRDVTERVQAERELRAANDALRIANADLEQFAYAAAHDLQEPLRSITIFAELLQRRHGAALAGDGMYFANNVVEGAHRMQSLVDDLLRYSRSVLDERPEAKSAGATEVLEQVLAGLAALISETGAAVTADSLPVVPVSATHLSQLFHNLIVNAIKYRRPEQPPRIHIEGQWQAGECTLHVHDNGQGIAPEYRERIFGLFKRLYSPSVPGTGLGLAISKRIVEHYGGRIWVTEGRNGEGSTFSIAIPAAG